jgi:hypothetical protein
MQTIKNITGKMSEEDLRTAFEEYAELKHTGILKQGIAREIEQEYKNIFGIKENVLETIREAIYYEMALRFYEQP